ncbi:hypothetical protein BGZ67_005464 [Mortierella alpina]|nr:hypothetical protein BGZ67_005464 [Mortierella alpina]
MTTASVRLDGLSEVTELERIPLPYKTLYHTLVFKNDMPVSLLQDRHHSSAHQLLTWIQAALELVQTVTQSQQYQQQQQQRDEEEDEELEAEIQDVVSGFGHYEPTIESSIEILLQLEECILQRLSLRPDFSPDYQETNSDHHKDDDNSQPHLSSEIEAILEQWSRLRGIIGELSGSVREHQRLRDGIQSLRNISEQTRQAAQILAKCLSDIAMDRQRCSEQALLAQATASRNNSVSSLSSDGNRTALPLTAESSSSSSSSMRPLGVDSNDMLELDSRIGLLALQIESLQKLYPECLRPRRSSKSSAKRRRSSQNQQQPERGSIADKKQVMQTLYQELLHDWHQLCARKDQLWRDLEECDRWRTSIEKMAKQIETMLEPVEVFHQRCVHLLATLDEQQRSLAVKGSGCAMEGGLLAKLSNALLEQSAHAIEQETRANLETLWSTLQELDEKQSMVAPAIENMFWVQEGEIQHRNKTGTLSTTTPRTATGTNPPPTPFPGPTSAVTPSISSMDSSPLYPNLEMLERQRSLKRRWSSLKTSLDTVGTKLHAHHTLLKERLDESLVKKEEAAAAEDKTLVGSGNSVDGNDWTTSNPPSPSAVRRSNTAGSPKSPRPGAVSPNWSCSSSTRILRGKLVPTLSAADTAAVRKFMLVKSDKPVWSKPRPWCPSVSVSSPSMPGFPLQTSSWGYFMVSPDGENGGLIAAPAPLPLRSPTPGSTSPTSSTAPKIINRPPFSPGGNRRYTTFNNWNTRPMPARSVSVAGGDYKNGNVVPMGPEPGGVIDWAKTLRRSSSTSFPNNKQTSPKGGNSKNNNKSPTTLSGSKASGGSARGVAKQDGLMTGPSTRRNSIASNTTHLGPQDESRRQKKHSHQRKQTMSPSSSSSEDETVMGHLSREPRSSHGAAQSRRGSRGGMGTLFGKNGLAPLTTLTDSNSSVDSLLSSSSLSSSGSSSSSSSSMYRGRNYTYGSSSVTSSSVGVRSPSPYTLPMFGTSFAAARSTAALHSALLASVSSTSWNSSSQRCSSSSLGGGGRGSGMSGQDTMAAREQQQQNQIMRLGGSSASSWMSMNTDSLISALSFSVPTYSFEDDFASMGSMEDSIAAM